MKTVLAALDASATARPVIDTARAMADLVGGTIDAVHVRNTAADTPEWLAARAGVPLRMLDGPVDDALLIALTNPEAVVGVFGARATPGGRRPAGHIALDVLQRSNKPIVIVPPEAAELGPPRPFVRLLLPLEGDEQSARAVADSLLPLIETAPVELVVLHVFTAASVPRVLDHPQRDLAMWGSEFVSRFCPTATDIQLGAGSVGGRIDELCRQGDIDLVVLSWSQNLSADHAAVIGDVLAHTRTPLLLLPVPPDPNEPTTPPAKSFGNVRQASQPR